MSPVKETLCEWLAQAGFPEADLEIQDKLLILRLPPDRTEQLITDTSLRQALVSEALARGFQRVALELKAA